MRRRWQIHELSDEAKNLAVRFSLHPVIVQVLLNRKVRPEDFHSFLEPERFSLFCPHLLPDLTRACQRIRKAVERGERILLYGDYDVDGVTSLTILNDYFNDTAANISFYIPHRVKEGFGLNKTAILKAKKDGVQLIITCDCGTSASEEIALAAGFGIDTIVVDHHQPKRKLKEAFAFINPKRKDSQYPFPDLSSAGVAFKLVQALKENPCFHLLDLVALSIVCDVVPLRSENRYLLVRGLERLKQGVRPSVLALCEASRIRPKNIEAFHLGYILGPRINASGRVHTALDALEMFLAKDYDSAKAFARKLDEYNRHRRDIESSVLKEAEEKILAEFEGASSLVVYKDGWHHGVLGIVASRLADKYGRPTFVIGFEDGRGKGSGRSVADFNLMEALGCCQEHLSNYGGHKKAAGIEVTHAEVERFKKRLDETVSQMVKEARLIPVVRIDAELSFKEISLKLAQDLESLKPFGEGNPAPLFLTRKVVTKSNPEKINSTKSSVWLECDGRTYEGVYFQRLGFSAIFNYGSCFDIVYTIEKNHYHNSVQLMIKDVRLS